MRVRVDAKLFRLMHSSVFVVLVAASASVSFAATQPELETLRIDSARSHAGFSLRAMLLLTIDGKFGKVSGSVHLDHRADAGWVDAVIDARTVEMSDRDRNDWARSVEFFDSARYPDIRFRSDPVARGVLRKGGEMRGRLSLRGVERAIVLNVLPADCDRPGRDCAMHAHGNISRGNFGMRSKRAIVGDSVVFDLWVFVEPDAH